MPEPILPRTRSGDSACCSGSRGASAKRCVGARHIGEDRHIRSTIQLEVFDLRNVPRSSSSNACRSV